MSLTLVVGLETLLRYQESKQRRTGHSDEDPRKTLTANESGKSEGRTEGGTEIPMIRPQKPKRERERVADLFALNLLDTPPEERYDRLTRELAVLLKVPIAYLALIDSNRQWLKSTVGTMPCQSDRDASFCAHTILSDQPLVVADTRRDPRFADHPLVKQEPFVRFYAGVPLRSSGGNNVGTLCIADRKPRRLGDHDLEILKAFAALIEKQVNASPQIFISYSHSDEDWKDRLTSHLGVLRNEDLLNFWDDRKIGAGDGWRGEIQQAMESSNLAVLLISANFLTSQFIKDVEVPRLLSRREKEGLVVLPIILKPCCWDQVEWLREMNVYPNDARPISSGTASQIDTDLAGFASRVLEGLGAPRGTARPASTRVDDADKVLRDIGFSTKGSRSESADAPSGKSLETSGLKLLVKKKDDATVQPDSCLFHQDCITIGRDPDNDLPLCDDGRVVSKRHAEIVRTGANGIST